MVSNAAKRLQTLHEWELPTKFAEPRLVVSRNLELKVVVDDGLGIVCLGRKLVPCFEIRRSSYMQHHTAPDRIHKQITETPDSTKANVDRPIDSGSQRRRFNTLYKEILSEPGFPLSVKSLVKRDMTRIKSLNSWGLFDWFRLRCSLNDPWCTIGTHLWYELKKASTMSSNCCVCLSIRWESRP